MGVKPFYYHYRRGKLFAFGSEIKALLRVEGVPRRLNEVMVADYLVYNFEDKEITFYQDIWRLPPACVMTVGREGAKMRKYWSLIPERELQLGSDEDYAEAYRETFTEAVRCRLRSALPVGSSLSGGLDSSSIVCVARDLLADEGGARTLRTFSAVFPDVPESDESEYIDAVVAQGGIEAHKVRCDLLNPLTAWERLLWHEDEPFFAINLFMNWGLYDCARQQNARVVLDGDGGDIVVGTGVEYLAELARRGRWMNLASEVNKLSKRLSYSRWEILLPYVLRPLAPEPARRTWRVLRGRKPEQPWSSGTVVSPDFARRINLKERYQALQGTRRGAARTLQEEHASDVTQGLNTLSFEMIDKVAAAFCVEPRHPFFDLRLVGYCLSLPPSQKLNDGWIRVVLRRALAGTLPVQVQWRGGKADLSATSTRGLLTERQRLRMVLDDLQPIEDYIDAAALDGAYRRYESQLTMADAIVVWKAATLAQWCRLTDIAR